MKILVLNGSPHSQGSTKDMVNAFKKGAESAGHIVDVVDVCKKKIGVWHVNTVIAKDTVSVFRRMICRKYIIF